MHFLQLEPNINTALKKVKYQHHQLLLLSIHKLKLFLGIVLKMTNPNGNKITLVSMGQKYSFSQEAKY